MRFSIATPLLLAIITGVSATLDVNNWYAFQGFRSSGNDLIIIRCYEDVYIYQSNNGGCDSGPNGICSNKPGAAPFHIPASNGGSSMLDLGWINNGEGTSVKISKTAAFNSGILQFEYTMGPGGLYWDLSDLDGAGPGLVGTPFANDNVKVSPTGAGSGSGTCVKIRCPAGQVCKDAYQNPDDKDTHYCPANTGAMYLDLCEPNPQFSNKRRSMKFSA